MSNSFVISAAKVRLLCYLCKPYIKKKTSEGLFFVEKGLPVVFFGVEKGLSVVFFLWGRLLFIGGDEGAESVLHGLVGIPVEVHLPCVGVETGARVGGNVVEAVDELLCRVA